MLKSLKNELKVEYYTSENWNLKLLSKNKFEAELCNKYQYIYYKDFNYKEAKYCIKKVLRLKISNINFKFLILLMKIYFIPKRLLKNLRNK